MEERDNDEEESRKGVGIRVQTWRFLRLNYCICEEERIYDVDGWLDAWKVSGFMSMEPNARAGHQHRSCLQHLVRRLDGYSSTYYSLLRHINMGERDSDEGKIFTQLSGSPGLSMSRVCYQRTNKEFEVLHDFQEAESSWNWSPNVAMVSLQDEQELSMLVYVSVAFLIVHIVKGTHYCFEFCC
ncbi:unnamed protein product [Prunus armeniaca]